MAVTAKDVGDRTLKHCWEWDAGVIVMEDSAELLQRSENQRVIWPKQNEIRI